MTDETDPTLDVARALRAIIELSALLHDQAANRASGEIPGGDAMVMLGPCSAIADFERRGELVEALWEASEHKEGYLPWVDNDDNWEPPLQTLMFWTEDRHPTHHATTVSEALWLLDNLRWLYDNEPHWDDLERDVAAARRRMEATLYAGEREERSDVPCLYCVTDHSGAPISIRLAKRYAGKPESDYWICPKCRREYGRDAYAQAKAAHLGSAPADRYVRLQDAIAAIPRPQTTVRSWLYRTEVETQPFTGEQKVSERGSVKWACDVQSRRLMVWWPHVRDKHGEKLAREAQKRAS